MLAMKDEIRTRIRIIAEDASIPKNEEAFVRMHGDRFNNSVHYSHNSIPSTYWDYGSIYTTGRYDTLYMPFITQWEHYVFISSASQNFMSEFKDGVLTISGERKEETTASDHKFHRVERRFGNFSRSFKMHDVDGERIAAEFKNGVLTIVAPKTPAATSRKIDIRVS